jgi:hypothetical protein
MVQQERNKMLNTDEADADDESRKAAGLAVIDLFAQMFAAQ